MGLLAGAFAVNSAILKGMRSWGLRVRRRRLDARGLSGLELLRRGGRLDLDLDAEKGASARLALPKANGGTVGG